jgi:hypothetical protein
MKDNINIELDKIKTNIPFKYFKMPTNSPRNNYFIGFNYAITETGLKLEISGKMFATFENLGSITYNNAPYITDKIYQLSNIKINNNYLLNNAPMYRIDIKKDVLVKDNPTYYISEIRNRVKNKTNKFDIYRFGDLTYEKGLVILPKAVKNYRFSIYLKQNEIKKSRNNEYRKIFSEDFLDELKNIIRFELQVKKYADMRKFLNLKVNVPTLLPILESDKNTIADFFEMLVE